MCQSFAYARCASHSYISGLYCPAPIILHCVTSKRKSQIVESTRELKSVSHLITVIIFYIRPYVVRYALSILCSSVNKYRVYTWDSHSFHSFSVNLLSKKAQVSLEAIHLNIIIK